MKYREIVVMLSLVMVIGCAVFTGCGSDSSSPTSPTGDPLNVSGSWKIQPQGYSIIQTVLAHSGATVTASDLKTYYVVNGATTYDNTAETFSGSTDSAAGATTGSRKITMTVKFVNTIGTITMTGTVSSDNSSMSGDYTDNSGGVGTWSATRQ
jgi:hypothetical protein